MDWRIQHTAILAALPTSDESWASDWEDIVYQESRISTVRAFHGQPHAYHGIAEPTTDASTVVKACNRTVDTAQHYYDSISGHRLCTNCRLGLADWNGVRRWCDWCIATENDVIDSWLIQSQHISPNPWVNTYGMDTP